MSQEFEFSVSITSNMMGNRKIKIIGGMNTFVPDTLLNPVEKIREISLLNSFDASSAIENISHVSAEMFKEILREILEKSEGI